jgi:tetratricopeptide (TPR) repeat protein
MQTISSNTEVFRMNRNSGLILALSVLLAAPVAAHAQQNCKVSNNMYTRSAALYLDRARVNTRADEKRELHQMALEQALNGTQNDAGNPKVWFMAGQAYVRLGDIAKADEMFDKAEQLCATFDGLQLERTNAWIVAYNAGVAANSQGKVDEAIAAMKQADMIYQGRPEARLNLGAFYANLGKHDEAIAAFKSALELMRGPAAEKLDAKQKAQWKENEEVAAFNMAQLLAIAGKDEEAVQAYRDFLAREPDNITAMQNLALVLTRQKKTAEAAKIYADLLARTDLTDRDYFTIGVGLFNAEQHENAAKAFRRAIELNKFSRDEFYNLSQAIYAPSLLIEDERSKATPAQQNKFDEQLKPMYEEIISSAEAARQFDPNNPNLYLLIARASRGLADLTKDAKASAAYREKALAALQQQKALTVEVGSVGIKAGETESVLSGSLENISLAPATPVRLKLTILARDGAVLHSEEVSLSAPAKGEAVPFEIKAPVKGADVGGWKYEIVR